MIYERTASQVAALHETFVADLRSLMMGLRLAGKLSPAGILEVRKEVRRALGEYLAAVNTAAIAHLTDVYGETPRMVAPKAMKLLRPVREIAQSEIQQLYAKIRGAGMKSLLSDSRGPFMQLAKKADERFDPTAQDSAGRTWNAGMLVKFLARDFAYQSFIDACEVSIRRDGGSEGRIAYFDPNHENNGRVVPVPLSSEIRAEIFHPNANAFLAHVSA